MRVWIGCIALLVLVAFQLPACGDEEPKNCSADAPWDCQTFCCPDNAPIGCIRSGTPGCALTSATCSSPPPSSGGEEVTCEREDF